MYRSNCRTYNSASFGLQSGSLECQDSSPRTFFLCSAAWSTLIPTSCLYFREPAGTHLSAFRLPGQIGMCAAVLLLAVGSGLGRIEAVHGDIDSESEAFRMSNACQGDVALVLNSHY